MRLSFGTNPCSDVQQIGDQLTKCYYKGKKNVTVDIIKGEACCKENALTKGSNMVIMDPNNYDSLIMPSLGIC